MAQSRRFLFHVPAELAGKSLGDVLRHWQPKQSWSALKELLRARRIMVDGNLALEPQVTLRAGQVIKLLPAAMARPVSDDDVRLCHVDDHVVVVDKPAGITSIRHPDEWRQNVGRRQRQLTLTEILPRIVARKLGANGRKAQQIRVIAVHRLDRETSGLMVFARTKRAEKLLGEQFREHSIQRVYWAIVAGHIEAQTIDVNLIADRGDGRRGVTARSDAGKRAVTHVKPLEYLVGATLVECRLETGRTHQIRIHLSYRGHPVLGDKVYGKPSRRGKRANDPARLALHAGKLGFVHPADQRFCQFDSALPADLADLLAALRESKE